MTNEKDLHNGSNLTEGQVIEIYSDAWFSGLSSKATADKHSVSDSIVKDIKCGKNWASTTGHIKGTKPTINKQITEAATEDITNLDYWF